MMQQQYTFNEFAFSSQLIRDLVSQKSTITPFIDTFFSFEALKNQVEKKGFTTDQRKLLVERLKVQNDRLLLSELTKVNIESLLAKNTFTVTTGHQLNLLTGPLYSLYKVAQVIAICNEMNSREQGINFVPVFWMATEDHDFDEINHINLFGNKIEWEKEGQENRIVGEIEPKDITSFLEQIEEKYNDENLKSILKSFTNIYRESSNLATATRMIMNRLFGSYGLVIIDGNDVELKKSFAPIAEKEVREEFVLSAVSSANTALAEHGYHNQVFVRNCNLFFIDKAGTRRRIAREKGLFKIDDQEISEEKLIQEIQKSPSQYSPNALLRPVYQELILPNLAYIGGGGEIAYWLQLKEVFDALNLQFPLLRVRDSILLLRKKEINDIAELEMDIPTLKRDVHALVKEIALEDVAVNIELKEELIGLGNIKEQLLVKAETINKGLGGMIEAEFTKMEKSIERIESKLIKAEKGKHEQKANKIKRLQNKIFPGGGFQERFENFLPYFLGNPSFVQHIMANLPAEDEPKIRVVEL